MQDKSTRYKKGAGEAGALGAPPAVINAICNALDLDHVDMPQSFENLAHIDFKNHNIN